MRSSSALYLITVAAAGHCWASLVLQGPVAFPVGIGNSTTVLSIDTNGTGSGCVAFTGGADVTGLGACPGGFAGSAGDESMSPDGTATRTIAELGAAGVANPQSLVLVLQATNAPTRTLALQDLALVFFDPSNDLTFTATLPGTPVPLPATTAPPGRVAAYAFTLDPFAAGLASDFFASGANRVGVALTLTGAGQGSARLFIAPGAGVASVPEPTTIGTTAAMLLAIAACCRARRRPNQ